MARAISAYGTYAFRADTESVVTARGTIVGLGIAKTAEAKRAAEKTGVNIATVYATREAREQGISKIERWTSSLAVSVH